MKTLDEVTLEARVIEGEKVLTRNFGEGWQRRIRIATLDVSSPYFCVIGQLYRDSELTYGSGLGHLMRLEGCGNSMTWGFGAESEADYRTLTAIWRRRITAWIDSDAELAISA